jgi:tetratricopeptide (TPR) repeat protein
LLAITRFAASSARWLLLLALLPSLQLVPIMRWWSPHYFYIPLAFLALVVAGELDQRVRRPWPAVALSLVPLVALSSAASARYRNDTALWAPEVRQQPACREGHFYLGEVARRASDLQSAVLHYARAVQPVPGVLAYVDELAAYENLGAVSLALGRLAEARTALEAALERAGEPERRRRVLYNLALVAFRAKDPLETARLLAPEAEAVAPLAPALLLRARALHELGREQEAARMLRLLPVDTSTGEPLATLR